MTDNAPELDGPTTNDASQVIAIVRPRREATQKCRTPRVQQTPLPPMKSNKKPRRRLREDLLALRQQVLDLEANLQSLHLYGKSIAQLSNAVAYWQDQARRELGARRRSELKNVWLHARLAHRIKVAQQLLRQKTILETACVRMDTVATGSSDDRFPCDSIQVSEGPLPGTVLIEVDATWRFEDYVVGPVEAAVWTLFSSVDCVTMTRFSVDYETVVSEATSVQSSFMIRSRDGTRFKGTQFARAGRDEHTGDFVVTLMAQTLPYDSTTGDVFANATLLEEDTTFRIHCNSTTSAAEVTIQRRFHLHASGTVSGECRQIAEAIAVHVEDEVAWMHDEVERRARNPDEISCVEQPPLKST